MWRLTLYKLITRACHMRDLCICTKVDLWICNLVFFMFAVRPCQSTKRYFLSSSGIVLKFLVRRKSTDLHPGSPSYWVHQFHKHFSFCYVKLRQRDERWNPHSCAVKQWTCKDSRVGFCRQKV